MPDTSINLLTETALVAEFNENGDLIRCHDVTDGKTVEKKKADKPLDTGNPPTTMNLVGIKSHEVLLHVDEHGAIYRCIHTPGCWVWC